MSSLSGTTPKTPSEKMKKRLEKKIRVKEERFRVTGDKNYIVERDEAQDELNELLQSKSFSEKNKKLKEKKKKKNKMNVSDEQAFQEAQKYNRAIKQEALKKQEQEMIQREKLKGTRAVAREKLERKRGEMNREKNLSLEERALENERKKKNWELYRDLYEQEYFKEHPEETLKPGDIDRDAKVNHDQEIKIKQKEAGIKAYEEEFKERKSMLQSYIDRTDMPCGDKGKTIRDMNSHHENQIKAIRDKYPKVLNILDKWVAMIDKEEQEEVEATEAVEDPVEVVEDPVPE